MGEHLSSPISKHTTWDRQLILSLALCALMCAVHSLDSPNTCGVLYSDAHFRGRRYYVDPPGTLSVWFGRSYYKISSIKVYPGWKMVVYDRTNYRGRYQILRSKKLRPGKYDRHQLKIGNDKVASVRCVHHTTVLKYEHEKNNKTKKSSRKTKKSSRSTKKTSRSTKCGVLYEHANFGGRKYSISHSTKFVGWFNDKTSSIVVNNGWIMDVYQHSNYRGRKLRLNPGRHNMSSLRRIGNDSISSVRCTKKTSRSTKKTGGSAQCGVLYEHDKLRGRQYPISHSTKFVGWFNDKTSSIVVNKGWIMYVYQHSNYRGRQTQFYPGRYNVSRLRRDGIGNDSISSVRCQNVWG